MNKHIFLFTNNYPLGKGEAFLESEIEEWGKTQDTTITIFPIIEEKKAARTTPLNVKIDKKLSAKLNYFQKNIFISFFILFINPFFWKEIYKYPQVFLNPKKFRKLFACSVFSTVISRYLIRHYKNELKQLDLFYTYWFYYGAYAGCLLKRKGYNFPLITRAHGGDIYEDRKETHYYIPFRRFDISQYIDSIYSVSEKGATYLNKHQNIPNKKITVSYLGVLPQEKTCKETEQNIISIVSCSYLTSLKRVDLIIQNLEHFSNKHTNLNIEWVHIGDGPLRSNLTQEANKKLRNKNIQFTFLGNLSNQEVLNYYKTHHIDCFLTTSSSEGIPVTIMEALSFGLPVVATNVGGISEAVNNENGMLLDPHFNYNQFENALLKMLEFKNKKYRETIAVNNSKRFNAPINYRKFINQVTNL